jgi:hypothetical protein
MVLNFIGVVQNLVAESGANQCSAVLLLQALAIRGQEVCKVVNS